MISFLKRIMNFGVTAQTPIDMALHYRVTNAMFVFFFFASFLETVVCFATGSFQAGIVNSTGPFVFAFSLWLMKRGHHDLARMFFFVVGCAGATVMMSALGSESNFQLIFLFASAIAIAIFSLDEKWLLAVGVSLPLVSLLFLEWNNYQPLFGMQHVPHTPQAIFIMRSLSLTIVWILMVAQFVYFVRERRRTQIQLVSSEKMTAMGRLASGIAHEINNPLQIIVSHAERLKNMTHATPETVSKTAEQIQTVAMRIAAINKGLLSLSRDSTNDSAKLVPVTGIVKLALDFCRAHLASSQVELRIADIPDHWMVMGKETQLSQVLLNLLNNAYDAVQDSTERWIRVDTAIENQTIEIAVVDSGHGVDRSILHRIFDPFFTTKPVGQGTGLGLSICQSIVAAHGGSIACEHQQPGARFVIRLPAISTAQSQDLPT